MVSEQGRSPSIPKSVGNYAFDRLLTIVTANRNTTGLDKELVPFHAVYFANGCDKRFMHTDKGSWGQLVLQVFERKHSEVFTFNSINTYIILHPFYIKNIIKKYFFIFVTALDKGIIFRLFARVACQ